MDVESVIIEDRVRKDFSGVDELAESIQSEGLIQPIVITFDGRLIAGERRLRACKLLGWKTIRAVYFELIKGDEEAHLARLEVAENVKRKNLTWQEHVLAVDKYHRIMSTAYALQSKAWGVRDTAKAISWSKSSVGRATFIASFIHAGDQDIIKAETFEDAFRVLIKRREDELSKQLVKGTSGGVVVAGKHDAETVADEDFFASVGTTGFVPGIGAPVDLDERPGQAVGGRAGTITVPLSAMFHHGDAVTYTRTLADASFDAVITDWPYGIDPENLTDRQADQVAVEHQVEANKALQAAIVPEIFRVLKDGGWFITWTDQMVWQYDYDLLVAAGFSVQRWPLTWHKTSACKNSCPQYNFTKNTEIAIVARKGNATLLRPQASSVWTGGNDVEERLLGHPFSKPFGLWEWVYGACCLRGATIYDPFVGSGSSTIPAIRLGLRPTGCESNESHYNRLMVNLQNLYKSLDPSCTFS